MVKLFYGCTKNTKRKTKGTIAKEKGLEPLSTWLLESKDSFESKIAELKKQYVDDSEGKVKDMQDALNGACDILVENFSQNVETKERLRTEYWATGKIKSEKRKDAETIKNHLNLLSESHQELYLKITQSIQNHGKEL